MFPVFQHALHFGLIRLFVLLYCRDEEWCLGTREYVLSVSCKIRENLLSWKWNHFEFKTHFDWQLLCIFVQPSVQAKVYPYVNAPKALSYLYPRDIDESKRGKTIQIPPIWPALEQIFTPSPLSQSALSSWSALFGTLGHSFTCQGRVAAWITALPVIYILERERGFCQISIYLYMHMA